MQTRIQIPVLKRGTDQSGNRVWIPCLHGKPVGDPAGYKTRREATAAAKLILERYLRS